MSASPATAVQSDVPTVEAGDVGSLEGADLDVAQGLDAVEQLEATDTLDEVAGRAGLEPEELRDGLSDDSSMFVTGSGFVGYADALEAAPEMPIASLAAAELPANVFDLNSRPTSTRVIYLDFDGHSASDPAWAGAGRYPAVINSAPFDTDGIPGFSVAEQAAIFEAWQRVAEDYRPFDVNVTTADPGVEGLRRTSPADTSYGQRMVVTPTNFTTPGTIGLALLNAFESDVDHAAYVFTDLAYKRTAKTMGEAVSHEAGHTLGLDHDGGPVSPNYYDGHGQWAPIMGRPINPATPVTQWSRGEYVGANNVQDDLAIIADGKVDGSGNRLTSGVGYRPDDHANAPAAATVVTSNGVATGNIERTGDRDVFAVDVLDGTLSVQLRPPTGEAAWSNLAATLTVRDGSGSVVASGGPSTASGWTVIATPTVVAGRYTIEVAPVGWLTASTGFTTYGSLGAYELSVSAPQGIPPPDAGTSRFTPVPPARLVDTRSGLGASGRVEAGRQIIVQVADGVIVPTDATAAVVNVAAVGPSGPGFVTVFPCSDSVPTASTLNFVAGQTVANTAIAALSASGQVCIYTQTATDIIVDVTGWLGKGSGSKFNALGPSRVMDTRTGQGGATRLPAGGTVQVDLSSLPSNTTAVALNVTSAAASGPGFATVYPCASGRPPTSTINFVAGSPRPNNTIVGVSGGVCIYSMTSTEIIVDLVGYFGSTGLSYLPTSPTRLLDTRQTTGYLAVTSAVSYRPAVASLGAYSAVAASVNVTAVDHLVAGYVTTYDCATRTTTSAVNAVVGQVNANGAIVPLANGLDSCLFTQSGGNLVVDLNGWWVR